MLADTRSLIKKLKDPVLVIDDDPGILFFLKFSLSRHGFRVDIADSGDKGIEKIQGKAYDVIITGIRMEPISGQHIAAFLRHVLKKDTPIIGISETPWPIDLDEFDAVLYKPFSTKDIIRVLQAVADTFLVKGNCY